MGKPQGKYVLESPTLSDLSLFFFFFLWEKEASKESVQSHYALLKVLGEIKGRKESFKEGLGDQFCRP